MRIFVVESKELNGIEYRIDDLLAKKFLELKENPLRFAFYKKKLSIGLNNFCSNKFLVFPRMEDE